MAPSSLYNDERTPPDDPTLLRMFLDVVASYEALAATYPLPTSYNFTRGVPPAEYWVLVLHAGLLRKFYAPRDQATLAKVVAAVERLATVADEGFAQELLDYQRYAEARAVPTRIKLNVAGHDVTQWEVVEVELYGRHLHSDYSKWQASQRMRDGSYDVFLGQWCRAAALVVTHAAARIRVWSERGLIDFDLPEQRPQADPRPDSGVRQASAGESVG